MTVLKVGESVDNISPRIHDVRSVWDPWFMASGPNKDVYKALSGQNLVQ
jgi:hypothetical protein